MKDLLYLGDIFNIHQKKQKISIINSKLSDSENWNNRKLMITLNKEKIFIESLIKIFINSSEELNFLNEIIDECQIDKTLINNFKTQLKIVHSKISDLEYKLMFTDPLDKNNAFIDIQSGSGGTDSQDWAQMIMRMYSRWGERNNFKVEIQYINYGDIVGITACTILISGINIYGFLKNEKGIHRLVRKSPFNANNKRHTSFASVFVYPEIEDKEMPIEIKNSDIRVDTFRASGAGGQHVNMTDSAVRITHIPTGVVVQCQNERSQHNNKNQALKRLKSKLLDIKLIEKNKLKEEEETKKENISWGHQIRSYILDQSKIKDLKTGIESFNTSEVLDGKIDIFIRSKIK